MNTKQIVQISIVVVGLALAGVSVALFNPLKSPVDLADTITLVDAEHGELYRVSVKRRGIMPPLRSPETDKLTLVPIHNEDGRWVVWPRYFSAIDDAGVDTEVWDQIKRGAFVPESDSSKLIEPKY